MSRIVRLVRKITATSGGWAGDGTVWNGDDPANAPKKASIQAIELTQPIMHSRSFNRGQMVEGRGWGGIVIVRDGAGAASTKRFEMRLVLAWEKVAPSAQLKDWRQAASSSPATPLDPRNIGDGEDFTTAPLELPGQDIALHLVPIGGNLAADSTVEIWASEFF